VARVGSLERVMQPTGRRTAGCLSPRVEPRATRFSAPSAAVTPPTDEPSDHEHGAYKSDDHAYADEQIGENDSGAALDGHAAVSRAGGRLGSPPPDA
jgi:hypothetical protein